MTTVWALFFSKMVEIYVECFSTFLTAINYSTMKKKKNHQEKSEYYNATTTTTTLHRTLLYIGDVMICIKIDNQQVCVHQNKTLQFLTHFRHGREREREEEQEQEAEAPAPEWPNHKAQLRFLLQAKLRGKGYPIRRPIHSEILHNQKGAAIGASQGSFFPTNQQHQQTKGQASLPFNHSILANKLHHLGAPCLAHPHPRPRHQEVKGCSFRVRNRGHEGLRGQNMATGDSTRWCEQKTHKGPQWMWNGEVQVQKRVHNILCLCC